MSPMTLRKRKATADDASRPPKQSGHTKSRRATSHAKVTAPNDGIEGKETVRAGWHSLSRELRDLVYECLWEHTPCVQPSPDRKARGTFEVHYRAVDTSVKYPLPRLPQWLWISRCFFYEGIEPMRKRGVWVVWWERFSGQDAASSSVLSPSSTTDVIIKSMRGLSAFPKRYYLCLNQQQLPSRLRNPEILSWVPSEHPPYEYIGPELSSKLGPVLKSLTVDLKIWTGCHPGFLQDEDMKWNLHLKALGDLKVRVERLTVCGTLNVGRIQGATQTRFLTALRGEVIRIRKRLVAKNGFVDMEEVDGKILSEERDQFDFQVRFRKRVHWTQRVRSGLGRC